MTDLEKKLMQMRVLKGAACPSCGAAVATGAYFCPNCGKKLKDKPPSTTISRQLVIYLVSLLLPPFGLWYAWKYLKQTDTKSKNIAWAAIILTFISLALTLWATKSMIDSVNQQLHLLNSLAE